MLRILRSFLAGRRGRRALFGAYLLAVVFATLVAGEAILRARGVQPWRTPRVPIEVEPGGRLFQRDPELGYRHLPGRFRVTLHDGYTFRVTHGRDGLRVTRPPEAPPPEEARPGLWIFGGSYTHGWTVDDRESFPWLVQRRLPETDVVNFGVNGYGTLHALLQLREALEAREPPRVAVYGYASFHDERNTFLRYRRKRVAPWNHLGPLVQPYARLDGEGGLETAMAEVTYREFPLQRELALAHFVEIQYNRFEDTLHRSDEVTRRLLLRFAREARAAGTTPLVVAITHDHAARKRLAWLESQGVATADIAVDLNVRAYTNWPHDLHPGPRAHRRYASALRRALRRQELF